MRLWFAVFRPTVSSIIIIVVVVVVASSESSYPAVEMVPRVASLCLLSLFVAMSGAIDPSFELFQDDLLVMVDKFEKSENQVAFLVSFLNPTEHMVKTSSPVHKFLPQSARYSKLLVTPHDPDFSDFVGKITPDSEFRISLYPKEQRTYTFTPLDSSPGPADHDDEESPDDPEDE